MKWHGVTRERLVRVGVNDDYDPKWGRFRPETRFNVNSSPFRYRPQTYLGSFVGKPKISKGLDTSTRKWPG